MIIDLSSEVVAIAQEFINTGEYATIEEVVCEALKYMMDLEKQKQSH